MRSTRSTNLLFALLATLSTASTAAAQVFEPSPRREPTPSRAFIGAGLMVATPQDEFSDYVNTGFGFTGNFIYALDRSGTVGIRLDVGYINYGRETKRACLSTTVGCRIQVDVATRNNIVVAGIGPQIMVPTGSIRPYVTGSAGLAYFFTESSVEGTRDFDDAGFFRTTNFDDATFAWTGAAGLYIPVRKGMKPIVIDLGVRYHGNGNAQYLREGSIDDTSTPIIITPVESKTNLLVYQLGVSFGL